MIKSYEEERARELQRQYLKDWRRKNKDKTREYNLNYWRRKAERENLDAGGVVANAER